MGDNLKQDIQKATFTRTATKDMVSGKITYSNFTPQSITLPAIKVSDMPKIDGYEVLSTQEDIPALTVNANSASQSVNILYRKVATTNMTIPYSTDPDYWYNYAGEKKKINKTYELGYGEGATGTTNNKWIVAHSTATPNATALNEAQYFKNNWSTSETYVQFVVDDKDCYQIGDPGYVAWGAGATANANSPVQIELCEFPNDKDRALKAYWNLVSLLRQFAKIYNIPIKVDENYPSAGIDTHAYLAQNNHETSHTDPYTYFTQIGISKAQFKKDVEGGINNYSGNGQTDSGSSDSGNTQTATRHSTTTNGVEYWTIGSNGLPEGFTPASYSFTATSRRNIYLYAPNRSNPYNNTLESGMSVTINATWSDGKYLWGHYLSYSGNHSYIIMKNVQSGKTFGTY